MAVPPVKPVDAKRSRTLISGKDVASVFNDDCISRLAKLSGLDDYISRLERFGSHVGDYMDRFGKGIRDSVQIYLRDAATPNENDIHREIANLHRAAHFARYKKSFEILSQLSPQTRTFLNRRNLPGVALLFDPTPLTDRAHQRRASELLAALCRIGAKLKEGRKRPGGRRSKPTLDFELYAPPARGWPSEPF